MSSAIPKTAWVNLYKQLQKEAGKIPQYNYRSFFQRRIRNHFEKYRSDLGAKSHEDLYSEGLRNLEVIKRQAAVCQLYPHKQTIIEKNLALIHQIIKMRECKKCKSNEYTNKQLVMMINECGHPICKNCVENIYARNSGNCHVCGRLLMKKGFREQIFDDPLIDKETYLRRKLRKIYNLKKDDFPSLKEFHDYQERFEVVVYNLVFESDVAETNAEIQAFEEQHKDIIDRNKRKLDEDQKWVEDNLKDEKAMKARMNEAQESDARDKENSSAVTDTKAIMDELRTSDVAAEEILNRERKKQIEKEMEEKEELEKRKKRNKELLQTRKRQAENLSFTSVMRIAGRPYIHQPLELVINGPPQPTLKQIETMGYLSHMRPASAGRIAGGYTATIGCARAVLESRIDLLVF